jgi:catechol 2,3-dioxygenase-like lactoylglutathione lyase family enzyme
MTTTDHQIATAARRFTDHRNAHGLRGIDHVGVACRNPDHSGLFVEQILGGIECFRAGYSEDERRAGRLRHIFYHIGAQLFEVVENRDPKNYPDPDSDDTNPHVAFGTSGESLLEFMVHLRANGIPFNGPRSHRDERVVSVYFRDPDGNNLEVCTWDPIDPELTTPMGGQYGGVKWSTLVHAWRP